MTTTTTTIWMARCRDCGLEQRRTTAPRLRVGAFDDSFCHDCVHPIEWRRYEVSEERYWRAERHENGAVVSNLRGPYPSRNVALEAVAIWECSYPRGGWRVVACVRRTLRRVG